MEYEFFKMLCEFLDIEKGKVDVKVVVIVMGIFSECLGVDYEFCIGE